MRCLALLGFYEKVLCVVFGMVGVVCSCLWVYMNVDVDEYFVGLMEMVL